MARVSVTSVCLWLAAAPEEQQVPDREQPTAGPEGEGGHEGAAGLGGQPGIRVLCEPLLQTAH